MAVLLPIARIGQDEAQVAHSLAVSRAIRGVAGLQPGT